MDNRLTVIVKESGLDQEKSEALLNTFGGLLQGVAEWEVRAKNIKVTDAGQHREMEIARAGRLYLRDQRVDIEKMRKKLKEQSLREGQAIDRIARMLTALISPIEQYLDQQEHFVEYKEKAEREARQAEIERRLAEEEAERVRKEKEAQERMREENERLRRERGEQERKLVDERRKMEAERARLERVAEEARRIAEAEKRKREEAEAAAKVLKQTTADATSGDSDISETLDAILEHRATCPKCGYIFKIGDVL